MPSCPENSALSAALPRSLDTFGCKAPKLMHFRPGVSFSASWKVGRWDAAGRWVHSRWCTTTVACRPWLSSYQHNLAERFQPL